MRCKRFVNVDTGEIFLSFAVFDDKTDGVGGWVYISHSQLQHIRENFCEYKETFKKNVAKENLDKLKKYLKESK